MPADIIDIHPHIIAPDVKRYPLDPLGGVQSGWSRDRPVSLEQMIAAMDQAGVKKAAIVHASTCYGHDNSYVADAVAAHPERFTGVFSADVLAADGPEKMKYWVGKKLTGLRLFTTGSTMPGQAGWLDDPRSFPCWEYAGKIGIPVCLQMTPDGIPALVNLAERFSNVKIILDHCARVSLEDGPPYAKAASFFALGKYKNIYLKLTQRNFDDSRKGKSTQAAFFERLLKEFGASRIAWGSNYPSSEGTLTSLLGLAKDSLSILSQSDQDWIFSKTAQVLYPALADKK